jgi:NitT/TauT family transport system substrate-binding protein
MRRTTVLGALVALALIAVACGGNSKASSGSSSTSGNGRQVTLHLGYFPNVTHATVIAGVEKGIFARNLGPGVKLQTSTFNAGPAAVEALFANALDASYAGPNPAINAFVRSHGDAIRIISGATSGGAFLVVRPDVNSAADLRGKKVASPQLGNSQDVALRTWLRGQGLRTDANGGGDVSVVPQDNAQTLQAFRSGDVAGAWVPEPWATRLVQEGGGKVLVDERTLWPNGQYATTLLVVRTAFMKDHPDVVEHLLAGQDEANDFVNQHPDEAQQAVNDGIAHITGNRTSDAVIKAAWANLSFTDDPIVASLKKASSDATALGFLDLQGLDLAKIYDLRPLNKVLAAKGKGQVSMS